jgi:hypothetical protein
MATPEGIGSQVRRRLAEQRTLVERLLRLRDQLGGSLFQRYGLCGKQGCACRRGRRHGPYYVLATRRSGQAGFAYLAAGQAAQARQLVAQHRRFRAGLGRLRGVNRRLVVLLKQYQTAASKRAGQRLGLAAAP